MPNVDEAAIHVLPDPNRGIIQLTIRNICLNILLMKIIRETIETFYNMTGVDNELLKHAIDSILSRMDGPDAAAAADDDDDDDVRLTNRLITFLANRRLVTVIMDKIREQQQQLPRPRPPPQVDGVAHTGGRRPKSSKKRPTARRRHSSKARNARRR